MSLFLLCSLAVVSQICLCSDASTSSEEEQNQEEDESELQHPVRDWRSLDFGIVRDCAVSKVC